MVNVKRKGSGWERDLTRKLNEGIEGARLKRIPGSGAMGTVLREPLLVGDVRGKVPGLTRPLVIEAKVGYGGAKQFALKKLWLDKIAEEAGSMYGIPLVVGKFSGARTGVKSFVVMDIEVFIYLMNEIGKMKGVIDEYAEDTSS